MTREVLTSTLSALSAELASAKSEAGLLSIRMARLQATRRQAYYDSEDDPDAASRLARLTKHVGPLNERKKQLTALQERLGRIGQALASDKTAWEAERATYESVVGLLGRIERQIVAPPSEAISAPLPGSETDERAFKPSTLLSVAGRSILDARKAALNPDDTDASRYEERLETAFAAFLEVVGDKPLSFYLPIHMQDFATFMARVPKNRSKVAHFRGLTLKQTVEANANLPLGQRKPCLSVTTVASYLSEVKNIWSRVSAGVPGLRDMGAYKVSMPKGTTQSIDREPLAVPSLNIWFRDAATPKSMKKPHKAWLPLAGLLTGMRLAELIYLQRTDIVDVEGNEVIDLTRPIKIGGQHVDRPVKAKTSKRYVAIHPLLRECGFIEYAKNVTSADGFVFSHFHLSDDPPDAAQKQMSKWMIALGIHETQRQVFHSLRHSAKDWFRDHVGERLADKQCGHAFSGVSANYGAKLLKPDEVQQISNMPAPKGVDFSAFIKQN